MDGYLVTICKEDDIRFYQTSTKLVEQLIFAYFNSTGDSDIRFVKYIEYCNTVGNRVGEVEAACFEQSANCIASYTVDLNCDKLTIYRTNRIPEENRNDENVWFEEFKGD